MKYVCLLTTRIAALLILSGCYSVGHQAYLSNRDDEIGTIMTYKKPFKYNNSGRLIRGDFGISGEGLTHITKDNNGNLIYHFSEEEILPSFHTKEWVGKCLIYMVVDSESYIIKDWGFDEGGNPLSCRTWP